MNDKIYMAFLEGSRPVDNGPRSDTTQNINYKPDIFRSTFKGNCLVSRNVGRYALSSGIEWCPKLLYITPRTAYAMPLNSQC